MEVQEFAMHIDVLGDMLERNTDAVERISLLAALSVMTSAMIKAQAEGTHV